MGLYIKDLDLPEGCGAITLKLWGDGMVEIFEEEEWRCAEAVSIPDHGDLIDRDVLLGGTEDVWEMSARYSDGGFSRFLIECEPVVIPGERKE